MTDITPDRRAELIAAELAAESTAEERAELDALRAVDPTVDAELGRLSRLTGALRSLDHWDPAAPSPGLRERISSAVMDAQASEDGASDLRLAPVVALRSRRGVGALLAGAAACLAIGVAVGSFLPREEAARPTGAPGTLGVVEPVDFVATSASVGVEGDLVAHTWGTETELVVDGVETGRTYTVTVIGRDGREYVSGSFLGSDVPVDCAMNASVLREDVASVVISDEGGRQIASAEVPPVRA